MYIHRTIFKVTNIDMVSTSSRNERVHTRNDIRYILVVWIVMRSFVGKEGRKDGRKEGGVVVP